MQEGIRSKLALLRLAKRLGNVSRACRVMHVSRDTFYRTRKLYARAGAVALVGRSRSKPVPANRVASEVEQAVVDFALEQPTWGQEHVAYELRKHAVVVSPAGVRSVWMRHDLQTAKLRLQALEAKCAQDDIDLSAAQWTALRTMRRHRARHEELESECPGDCGAQDALYVGSPRGVGRVYQQTFIDIYSKVAFAKLYPSNVAWTAVDLLRDFVAPFFREHGIPLCRVLTDHGTEYCGDPAHHAYQAYLAAEGIQHLKTKVVHPGSAGICAQFHALVRDEFYRETFRKTRHAGIDALQRDLDAWLHGYNHDRPHAGRWCYGKTPMRTFVDSVALAKNRATAA